MGKQCGKLITNRKKDITNQSLLLRISQNKKISRKMHTYDQHCTFIFDEISSKHLLISGIKNFSKNANEYKILYFPQTISFQYLLVVISTGGFGYSLGGKDTSSWHCHGLFFLPIIMYSLIKSKRMKKKNHESIGRQKHVERKCKTVARERKKKGVRKGRKKSVTKQDRQVLGTYTYYSVLFCCCFFFFFF